MTTESAAEASPPLTVAVTGPTGDIGRSLLRVLDRNPRVGRVAAMARRPFDPAAEGLRKVEYRRADVLDADAVAEVIAGADVVVHLAFMIMGGAQDTTEINLTGSRNVFTAAIDAGVARLVYASSVAAYGFGADNPPVLTEDLEPRGTRRHYYSAHKAELELALREMLAGSDVDAYVFRPCIVAGPDALTLVETIPYVQLSEKMPGPILRALEFMPALRPVIPDPGVPFQLVHHDDVATAMEAAVMGQGEPGVYNLAGDGTLTMADLAGALGWYSIPVPELAVDVAAELVARLPFVPDEAQWIESARRPVIMDTTRARTILGWQPRHGARETLEEMVRAARSERLIR
ncbi:MAG TPA: NAD-dependent epimerase/dehydratase family protein [Solirubrobacteraceae bacterium]|jgi:nucleoside-diphosphate-sugar epimerase|nr:NAD-dependent epimerase/dehydratase family protein [Solirubrobacteraceae bacterium]